MAHAGFFQIILVVAANKQVRSDDIMQTIQQDITFQVSQIALSANWYRHISVSIDIGWYQMYELGNIGKLVQVRYPFFVIMAMTVKTTYYPT